MKTRAAKFVAAIVASIVSSANLVAAPDSTEQAADKCLTSPGEKTPPGGHWRYRIERGTGRQCWYVKTDGEKSARKAPPAETPAAEEPAPAPSRTNSVPPRSPSDAHAEFSRTRVAPDANSAPSQRAPAPPAAAAIVGAPPSAARDTNMMAPAPTVRWPDPMSAASPAANPPAAPEQSAEVRSAPATVPPAKPMPRAVPPVPASEKPLSLPMLITIVAGGLSVVGLIVSMLFGWRASRPRLTPSAPMPPLEVDAPNYPRRPGDLYRARKRTRASLSGPTAA